MQIGSYCFPFGWRTVLVLEDGTKWRHVTFMDSSGMSEHLIPIEDEIKAMQEPLSDPAKEERRNKQQVQTFRNAAKRFGCTTPVAKALGLRGAITPPRAKPLESETMTTKAKTKTKAKPKAEAKTKGKAKAGGIVAGVREAIGAFCKDAGAALVKLTREQAAECRAAVAKAVPAASEGTIRTQMSRLRTATK